MKKNIRKVAVILVIIMLANIFTGCLSWYLMTGEQLKIRDVSYAAVLLPFVDIAMLPIALVVFAVRLGVQAERNKRGDAFDHVDTFSVSGSFSKAEINTLIQRYNSLPEDRIHDFTNTVNSFSDKEILSIIEAYDNLSDRDIAVSIKVLNLVPDEILINTLNNLQYAEFCYQ